MPHNVRIVPPDVNLSEVLSGQGTKMNGGFAQNDSITRRARGALRHAGRIWKSLELEVRFRGSSGLDPSRRDTTHRRRTSQAPGAKARTGARCARDDAAKGLGPARRE